MTSSDPVRDSGAPFRMQQVLGSRAQVEHQIREAILRGDVAPGERLPPETELAKQLGVSRPTVREALGALAAAGLIRKVAGVAGGNFVNSATPDSLTTMLSDSMATILRLGSLQVDEVAALRRVLERPAAAWAAEHRTPEQVARLTNIVERAKTATARDRVAAYSRDFHAATAQASGNRLLAVLVSAIDRALGPAETAPFTTEVGRSTALQHEAIVRAIHEGSAANAADAMGEHLDYILSSATDSPRTDQE